MTKKQKFGACAACGRDAQLTREHVPPKNLFLPPRPTNTITTWTCACCNKGTELDDEYFRLFVTTGAEPDSRAGQLWTEKVVGSSFSRSPALKVQLHNDRVRLRQRHEVHSLQTYGGDPAADEDVDRCIILDASRINRIAEKIVRCLYFHHHSAPLPPSLSFQISLAPLSDLKLEKVIRERRGLVGGEKGEFIYWYRFSDHGRFISEWILLFHLQNCITVTTGQEKTNRVSARFVSVITTPSEAESWCSRGSKHACITVQAFYRGLAVFSDRILRAWPR